MIKSTLLQGPCSGCLSRTGLVVVTSVLKRRMKMFHLNRHLSHRTRIRYARRGDDSGIIQFHRLETIKQEHNTVKAR